MSTALKWITGLVIIAALAWLAWWSGWVTLPGSQPKAASTQSATSTDEQAAAQQPTNGMSAATDTSDAAISQDTAAIDAQMQGLDTDSANIDSSLNDQPVSQSY